MKMRKIIAILAAVLMLCSVLPMSAFAAAGDVAVDLNFDDGSNGGFERAYNENGYIVFDATTADWQNTYAYKTLKANTLYKVTFSAKANKEASLAFKINNNWGGDTVKESVAVTTEWQNFELIVNSGNLSSAILMFASDYPAASAAIYHIDNLKIVETIDPALIGKVINGDFSDNSGWKLGSGASIANGVLTLTNIGAWSEAAMQTVPVKANTNYEISWKSQLVSGSGVTNMILMDASYANYKLTSGQNWMNSTSTSWVNHSVTLNTGDHESIIFKLTSESGGTKTINIDDIKITEVKDPSFDGILYNGDFETGKILPWENLWGSNTVEMVAGQNSDYALKGTGGTWTQVYQSVTVEPNTDYIVTAWAKDASNSALWVKNAGGNGDIGSKNFATGSDWQLNTLTFNSGSNNSVWIGLMSLATGGTYTVDNIKVSKAVAPSNDGYINNGNFEGGSLSSWTCIWDSQISASIVDDGHDSAFAVKAIGKAPWGQVRQKVTVEANTDYKVTLWAKDVNNMALLIKDGADANNIVNSGINAGDEWTEISVTFNSGDNTSVYVGVMVNEASSYGTFDDISMEKLAPAHVCEFVGAETLAPTCTEPGEMTYSCTCGEGTYTEEIPAGHDNLTYAAEKQPENCQDQGNMEYWYCEICDGYFADENAESGLNPAWIFSTGDCVRPDDAAACATVPCVLCGADTYGAGNHAVVLCQGGICSACGEECFGYGCSYDIELEIPACQPGECQYCGTYYENGLYECENGAWAACLTGECVYGCGKTFDATEPHTFEEGVTACDGGLCWNCWEMIDPADHVYDNTCDADCNVCGEEREAPHRYNPYAPCDTTCNECEEVTREAPVAHTFNNPCDTACAKCFDEVREAAHSLIHVAAKDATCGEDGTLEYWYCEHCGAAWRDAECKYNTTSKRQQIPATGEHEYFYACDVICMVCGQETNTEAAHNLIHVEAKAPTCTEIGNVEYWYCDACGTAWLDAECMIVTNQKAVKLGATCATNAIHTEGVEPGCHYTGWTENWYCANCDVYYLDAECTVITNYKSLTIPALESSATYAPAVAGNCQTIGNVEYWYCEECQQVWTDEALTQLTNFKSVKTGYGDHVYVNGAASRCTICEELVEDDAQIEMPILTYRQASISEPNDKIGYALAFRFKVAVSGMKFVEGEGFKANYDDATVIIDGEECKLNGLGVYLETVHGNATVPAVNMYGIGDDFATFTARLINIPESHLNTIVTAWAYYEVDGIEYAIEGTAQYSASYAGVEAAANAE